MKRSFLSLVLVCAGCGNATENLDASNPSEADSAVTDASVSDASPRDASDQLVDASTPDARADATIDANTVDAADPVRPSYTMLSETGLYSNIATKTIAANTMEFEPAHVLWSDGAEKTRWIQLPSGQQIDTSNMDHWKFPIGTKVFKEFANTDAGYLRLETRLIERWGPNPGDFWMGSFEWNSDESDAVFRPLGAQNVRGTNHDLPGESDCIRCHGGEEHRILGFSAVQLSHNKAINLKQLALAGQLTNPPPANTDYPVPGNSTESQALGYLHANCGHCHNPEFATQCLNQTGGVANGVKLRVYTTDATVEATDAYTSNVGQPLQFWPHGTITLRIAPGNPDMSAVLFRMESRTETDQMPPSFTEDTDVAGNLLVRAWIMSLPSN